MRADIYVQEFDVNVAQKGLSKGTLHLAIETNDGDVDMFMSVEQIQEFLNLAQKSLDEYKLYFNIE